MIPSFVPSTSFEILGGTARVLGYGAQSDGFDFSLRGLQNDGDETKQENEGLVRCLREVADHFDLRSICAPRPVKMNGEIVSPQDLGAWIPVRLESLGDTGTLQTFLQRGVDADGVRLPMKSAFAMSAADCALIVVKWREQMWAAHAGRDSLMDRVFIESEGWQLHNRNIRRSKRYSSVVDSIMAEIPPKFRRETSVYYGCTISPGEHFQHRVDDPQYGEFNQKMMEYFEWEYRLHSEKDHKVTVGDWKLGQIDMRALIRAQFERYGVTKFETDEICTFTETNPDGSFKWHSNRRDKVKRNLFLVIR